MNTFWIWVRTIGQRALLPVLIGIGLLFLMSAAGVSARWWWLTATGWFTLMMTIPLSEVLVFAPGETWVERRAREREQAKARTKLATFGLTPEKYISTIPQDQLVERWKAAYWLGVDAT